MVTAMQVSLYVFYLGVSNQLTLSFLYCPNQPICIKSSQASDSYEQVMGTD